MRIVAGEFRGRKIIVPDTPDTRPTMDKTRQAIFNILRSAVWALKPDGTPILQDARVIDVFAGSGAMGLEALSQGAANAVFVETSRPAVDAIRANIAAINLEKRASVLNKDATKLPPHSGAPFDVVFLDPPYKRELLSGAIQCLKEQNYITSASLLVLEMQKREDPPEEGLEILDTRIYGVSKVTFAKI